MKRQGFTRCFQRDLLLYVGGVFAPSGDTSPAPGVARPRGGLMLGTLTRPALNLKVVEMMKALLIVLASAIAIALSLPELQAATFVSMGSQPKGENVAQVVKTKGAKSKGPGSCGTNMYYDNKTRKCVDARGKK